MLGGLPEKFCLPLIQWKLHVKNIISLQNDSSKRTQAKTYHYSCVIIVILQGCSTGRSAHIEWTNFGWGEHPLSPPLPTPM